MADVVVSRKNRAGSRALAEALEDRRLLSFGLTTTSSSYTVDTGANTVFTVSRSDGDLTSIKFKGTELTAPFSSTSRFSHYESGLSSSTVVSAAIDPLGNWIKITCDDTGSSGVGVIQYYLAHKGDDDVYMATYAPGPASPSPGEMRFITYLNFGIFTNHPAQSDTSDGQTAIESTDVFENPATGQTHSKYYGEVRAIDDVDHGATGSSGGSNFGVFMFMGNRESSSGGPFFKDIDFQSTGAAVELYNYMFSGHSQTENFRPGLQGPYALAVTDGSAPTIPDYSFIASASLTGYVPASGRGTLSGKESGVPSGHVATVGLSNSVAQYWGTPDSSGNYTISGVKPGTYVETLYQDELAAGSLGAVTISAGGTTRQNITDTLFTPAASSTIFRIGTLDGTPIGFLNADKIQDMHPSDSRMTPWDSTGNTGVTGMTNFTVGVTADSSWPMAEWKYQNASAPDTDTENRITFTLTSAQVSTPMTLRIGITRANGDGGAGRPIISVNGGNFGSAPAASSQPDSRGVTTGNWRGNNVLYTYNLSTSSLHTGTNTIDIEVASGNTSTGDGWLGPWFIYDAIDLVTTSSLTNAPKLTSIAVSPGSPMLALNSAQTFTATAKDQFGNPTPANFIWSAMHGTIDGTGAYLAPGTAGPDSITATSGTISMADAISIINNPPKIAMAAGASPNPVTGLTTALSVLGSDDGGESNLTYVWSVQSGPGNVTFVNNGGNGGKNATANFSGPGIYVLGVTATDAGGLTTSSDVTVNVLVSNIAGTPGNDAIKLERDGANLDVFINSTTPSYSVPFALEGALAVQGLGGDDTLTIDYSGGEPLPGGTISFDGGGGNDNVMIAGAATADTVVFAGGNSTLSAANAAMLSATVNSGAALILDTQALNHLLINGSAAYPANAATPLVVQSVNVTSGGSFDLANNGLIVDYTGASPLSSIQALLAAGFNGGNWNGNGIRSSSAASDPAFIHALGYAEASDLGLSLFMGTPVDMTAILIRYTRYGDSNLDGTVDVGNDFDLLLGGLAATNASSWVNGDYTYDGKIDLGNDFNLYMSSLLTQ